jgi:hypothetical protein
MDEVNAENSDEIYPMMDTSSRPKINKMIKSVAKSGEDDDIVSENS